MESIPGDEVGFDQVSMDAEQGADTLGQQQYLTRADLEQVLGPLATQLHRMEQENRGVASKVDRGLNAIRRDSEAAGRQKAIEQRVAAAPEEAQPWLRENLLGMLAEQAPPAQEPEPYTPPPAESADTAGIRTFVQQAGMRPEDVPRSVYALMHQAGKSQEALEMDFINALYAYKYRGAQTQTRGRPGAPATVATPHANPVNPQPPAPPVERSAAGGPAISTASDLANAIAEGQITAEVGREEARKRGWEL